METSHNKRFSEMAVGEETGCSDISAVYGGASIVLDKITGFDINAMSQAMFGFMNLFGDDLGLGEMPRISIKANSVTELSSGKVLVNVTISDDIHGTVTDDIIMIKQNSQRVLDVDMID